MTVRGTVRFQELEGGVWLLELDEGGSYELAGGDRHLKCDGLRIEADGALATDVSSIAMVGPVFEVSSYRQL